MHHGYTTADLPESMCHSGMVQPDLPAAVTDDWARIISKGWPIEKSWRNRIWWRQMILMRYDLTRHRTVDGESATNANFSAFVCRRPTRDSDRIQFCCHCLLV